VVVVKAAPELGAVVLDSTALRTDEPSPSRSVPELALRVDAEGLAGTLGPACRLRAGLWTSCCKALPRDEGCSAPSTSSVCSSRRSMQTSTRMR